MEGLFVFWSLLSEPSEIQSAVLFGFSPLRLILLSVVLVSCMVLLISGVAFLSGRGQDHRMGGFIWDVMDQKTTFWILLLLVGIIYISLFSQYKPLEYFYPFRERLLPLLIWMGLASIQALLSYLYLRCMGLDLFQTFRGVLVPAFIALMLMVLLIAFIFLSGMGLTPDSRFWQNAGVPILLPQVILILAVAWGLVSFLHHFRFQSAVNFDRMISIGLWAIACFAWLSQPSKPSYNSLPPSAPNFQTYPFGDAMVYDITAHEFLVGNPIPNEFGVKPLYSLFLASLHLASGENYNTLISLQIAVLALTPVFVYRITLLVGNRLAGVLAALLIIIRERNGIALSNVIEVSHSKLLMSDGFAMGLVAAFLWLFLSWCDNPEKRRAALFASGAVLSLLSLTRGHPIILVPLVICIILFMRYIPIRLRFQGIIALAVGVLLPLIPWFLRIYEISGKLAIQDPASSYTTHFARSYSPEADIPIRLEGETDKEYYERINEQAQQFIAQHPDQVAKFVLSHVMHNTVLSYVYLPHSFTIENLREYIYKASFWRDWSGRLHGQEIALLSLNILLIALGIGKAWNNKHLIALMPLLIGAGYNFSVSVGRVSGWRYIQPADWVTLIYYAVGLAQLCFIINFILERTTQMALDSASEPLQASKSPAREWSQNAGVVFTFVSIGVLLTYGHLLFVGRFPVKSVDQLFAEYSNAIDLPDQFASDDEFFTLVQTGAIKIMRGDAIYPYYMKENAEVLNHFLPGFKQRPFDRLVFYLAGRESSFVILPVSSAKYVIHDGAGVIVIGCPTDADVVNAISVLVTGDRPVLLTGTLSPDQICPRP
jgi:hypothetical protein